MNLFIRTVLVMLGISSGLPPVLGAEEPGYRAYHLFHPTPDEELRDLSPDRPDATESPVTVDAGRFVIEASYFDWRRDQGTESRTLMSTNLKAGLTENTDLQFVFDGFTREENRDTGFENVQLRLKRNLWGNDGGKTAFAVFPYVQFPANSSEWEGGLMFPFAMTLTERIGLGLMSEFDVVYNEMTFRHEFSYLHTVVLGIELTDRLGAYVEFMGIAGETPYEAYGSGGFAYSVSDHLILDCGALIGLNRAAEELGLFAGFTRRF